MFNLRSFAVFFIVHKIVGQHTSSSINGVNPDLFDEAISFINDTSIKAHSFKDEQQYFVEQHSDQIHSQYKLMKQTLDEKLNEARNFDIQHVKCKENASGKNISICLLLEEQVNDIEKKLQIKCDVCYHNYILQADMYLLNILAKMQDILKVFDGLVEELDACEDDSCILKVVSKTVKANNNVNLIIRYSVEDYLAKSETWLRNTYECFNRGSTLFLEKTESIMNIFCDCTSI